MYSEIKQYGMYCGSLTMLKTTHTKFIYKSVLIS